MNTLTTIQAFADRRTEVRALEGDPLVLRIGVGPTNVDIFVATLQPDDDELEAAAAFLDTLVLAAVELRMTVLHRLARKDEPTKVTVER